MMDEAFNKPKHRNEGNERNIFVEVEEVEQLAKANGHKLDALGIKLDGAVDLLEQIIALLVPPPARSVGFTFASQQGEINMPLTAPANTKNERAYIMGNDAADGSGQSGAPLDVGQTIAVVSADPATVDFTPDSPARKNNEGVQSVLSGAVNFKNPPAQQDVPITVTATVSNADGTPAETANDTVTVTAPVAGPAKSIGELFEQDVAGVPGTAARKPR